jgi:bisanhydrobacterioruberin hydratase
MNAYLKIANAHKANIALIAALSFHFFGAIGIAQRMPFFMNATSLNLILMAAIVWWTYEANYKSLLQFFLISFTIGIAVELIGVNTGYLFGDYKYGDLMGVKIAGVPLLIGVNWFVTLYCCARVIEFLFEKIKFNSTILFTITTAALATAYDWLIEPCAIELKWWNWSTDPVVPIYNYVCWFACSLPIAFLYKRLALSKQHQFPIQLFIIQILFFITLRIWL